MKIVLLIIVSMLLMSCSTAKSFKPKSQYPPDPWVQGYAKAQDCLGGEALAARHFQLPDYPRKAFNSGRQGWVLLKLDVLATGEVDNIDIDRSVPEGIFDGNAKSAAKKWMFFPPKNGALADCRVLIRYRFGKVSLGK